MQRPLLQKREGDKVPVILFGAAMECPPEFPVPPLFYAECLLGKIRSSYCNG